VSTGAGWQVPRRQANTKFTAFYRGYRGMDNMHSPHATASRVNAHCGTPENSDVPCNPLGYMPTGRVPVLTHDVFMIRL
jgi:hypothetical protein